MSRLTKTCMQTYSGKFFDYKDFSDYEYPIEEIASALSNICRFNGHLKYFYSVAQHSVIVSNIVPPKLALEALLHDAAEAYVGDTITPLKNAGPGFKALEAQIDDKIRAQFGLPIDMSRKVHDADMVAFATEVRDVLGPASEENDSLDWLKRLDIKPTARAIVPMLPDEAKHVFMARYKEITRSQLT